MATTPPSNVGILAMDLYFPRTTVNQSALETHDGAPKGKYTTGLGQTNMAFVSDREDIISISLTAVQNFFEKYNVSPKQIGRLEVGTETIIDKSKSVKSYLMELFEQSGNFNVEGVDTMNACYGGTNALFNSVNWVESQSWDGRYALVVAADIAIYAEGNARPTGGCGAVIMLVGPDAPLVIESKIRGSHVEHTWDFYKPRLDVEYPVVDGQLSIQCYLKALDQCYDIYSAKFKEINGEDFSLKTGDYFIFHSPYNGLVRKSVGRLMFNDFLRNPDLPEFQPYQKYKHQQRSKTYFNRSIGNDFQKLAGNIYQEKIQPGTLLPIELGNCYCASLYAGLVSLLENKAESLLGKRITMFSYGSGMAASMFSFKVVKPVEFIKSANKISQRLSKRKFVDPPDFVKTLELREKRVTGSAYVPEGDLGDLFPGTYYLEKVDEKYRRYYKRLAKAEAKL